MEGYVIYFMADTLLDLFSDLIIVDEESGLGLGNGSFLLVCYEHFSRVVVASLLQIMFSWAGIEIGGLEFWLRWCEGFVS